MHIIYLEFHVLIQPYLDLHTLKVSFVQVLGNGLTQQWIHSISLFVSSIGISTCLKKDQENMTRSQYFNLHDKSYQISHCIALAFSNSFILFRCYVKLCTATVIVF